MRRLIVLTLVFALVFSTAALGAKKKVEATKARAAIIGEVVSLKDGVIMVKEDATGKEYMIQATKTQLKGVKEGYRVEVGVSKGKARTIKVLGITMGAMKS